jgi:anti-sigma regulatory factor (Ser/Thr protein kinase)
MTERLERTWELEADTMAARRARRFVRQLLEQHGTSDEVAEVVELLASELVTNAVRHGEEPRQLRCLIENDRLTVSVSDGSEAPPTLRSPAPLEPHGRGLRLVAMLAERWGVNVRPGQGKDVWFSSTVPRAGINSAR